MRIRSQSRFQAVGLVAASLVTLGMPGALLWLKTRDGSASGCLVLFVVPFAMMAVALAVMAARQIRTLRRYGAWELECPDGGGLTGEPLELRVRPGRAIVPNGAITLTLTCIRVTRSRSGQHGSSAETSRIGSLEVKRHVEGPIDPRTGFGATFDLPASWPATATRGGVSVVWQLETDVPTADGGVQTAFFVPVRAGAAATPDLAAAFDG
jgi:hypothetical protein